MVNPYETPSLHGNESDDRKESRRFYVPLLLTWGVIPICLSLRQFWHVVENVNAVGHFYPGLIWDGVLEYALLATWLLAVWIRSTKWPIARLIRAVAFLPALCFCVAAVCSIIKHPLPGGGFYIPTVLAHDGLRESLGFHMLYAVIFIPFFSYAIMVFRDGYVAFQLIDWRSPFAMQSIQTNQAVNRSRRS